LKLSLKAAIAFALAASSVSRMAAGSEGLASRASGSVPVGQSIAWSELGTKATAQYAGDGLAVCAAQDGTVRLRCKFQQLEGEVTRDGLWLTSTVEGTRPNSFQVVADYIGRDGGVMVALPETGVAVHEAGVARFVRRGLVEEYSVSVDGVRQDFVVTEPPGGAGALRVDLTVTGARAEAAPDGARLVLEGTGRKLAYSRLRVTDATGKELLARMEIAPVAAEVTRLISDAENREPNAEQRQSLLMSAATSGRLAVVVEDGDATYPVRIDPTFSDESWGSVGGWPGTDPMALTAVWAAAADAAGNFYVGGRFTAIGDVVAFNIAKWDGSRWSALGLGLSDLVYGLVVSGSNVYAVGSFIYATNTGPTAVPVNYIAKWDGKTRSALGSGMVAFMGVNALAVSGSDLFAGGYFASAGGVPARFVAKWNGSVWSALGSGMDGPVMSLVVMGTDLYAGGFFYTAGGVEVRYMAKWNGSAWSALGSGMGAPVMSLAVLGANVYAGGTFTSAGGTPANYVAKWNGSAWSALGLGMDNSVNALVASGANLYAGGDFTKAGGVAANRVAKWNGSSWSAMDSGMGTRPGSETTASVKALAMSGSTLYAGGTFTTAGGMGAKNIAKWNGSAWSAVSSGISDYVNALAVSGSNVYVGGNFTTVYGSAGNYVAKWNPATGWMALGSGLSDGITALAVSEANLYAAGYFTTAGGVTANKIAKWDGSAWSALGTGIGGNTPYIWALVASGTSLYAGGSFTTAGGVAANGIAKWNGTSWSALGSGMDSTVFVLAVSGTDLYAGGGFKWAGGVAADRIAKWDGSAWSALGSGMDSTVSALAVIGSDLYAGGWFTTAGG
jgi:hypothetical protein